MLTQKLILGYSSRIVIQLTTMLVGIIVARIAGPTVIGTISFGMSFVSMFTFFADLGMGSAHIKLISEGRNPGDCIRTFSIIKSFLVAIFVSLVILYIVFQRYVFQIQFESLDHLYVIIIWLVAITIGQFLYIPITTFMAFTQQAKQDIPSLIQTFVTQGLRILVIFICASAITLSLANLVGMVIVIPLYFYLFHNYPTGRFDKGLAKDYIKIARPIILLVLAGTFTGYFDKVLLQYFTNSEQVGYYTAGYSIGGFIQTIGLTTGLLFFPTFSAAVGKQNYDYINRTIEKFERFVYLFIMPVVVFLMLYSKVIISLLLGSRYLPSGNVLFVILVGALFVIVNQHYGNLLMGAGFITETAYLNLFSLLFFIFLNIIFVAPQLLNLKSFGSALALALNYLFLGMLYRIFVSKLIKAVPAWRNKKFLLFGLLNFLIFLLLYKMLNINANFILKIIFPFGYFGLTYLMLYVSNLLHKEDILIALKIFDIKAIKNYIKDELIR